MDKQTDRVRIKDIAKQANVSIGTVDRVLHGRGGVSEKNKKKIEEILKQMNYRPNMYASALASNKKYNFICLLPKHLNGEYWTAVEKGIYDAIATYSDFHLSVNICHYDPYDYRTFVESSQSILNKRPDGVIMAPTAPEYTNPFTPKLQKENIPYIYIDSNIGTTPLGFFGQDSQQSGYFAARMLLLLMQDQNEVVIFRKIHKGIIGSNQQKDRENGFRQYIREHRPDCLIYELNLHADSDEDDQQMIAHFFRTHPNVKNGITFNSKVYIIGEYLQQNKQTDFHLIGYDLLKRNVDCLKTGSVTFLIAQQPERQGFNSVQWLCDFLIFKKKVNCINYMPIVLLSKETIDYYHDK